MHTYRGLSRSNHIASGAVLRTKGVEALLLLIDSCVEAPAPCTIPQDLRKHCTLASRATVAGASLFYDHMSFPTIKTDVASTCTQYKAS